MLRALGDSNTAWLEKHERALEVDPLDSDALCRRSGRLWSLSRDHEALDADEKRRSGKARRPVLIARSVVTIELAERETSGRGDVRRILRSKLDHASFDSLEFAAWYGASAPASTRAWCSAARAALAQRPGGTRAWAAAGLWGDCRR